MSDCYRDCVQEDTAAKNLRVALSVLKYSRKQGLARNAMFDRALMESLIQSKSR